MILLAFEQSKNETMKHIQTVGKYILSLVAHLLERATKHDASKLVSPEVEIFDEFTPKLKGSTYQSPEYEEFRKQMKPALDHHYEKNDHHPEHFKNGMKDMDLLQLTELLCDWKAASLRHDDGDIRTSIEKNQDRFGYSDDVKAILLNTVNNMKW